MLVPLPLLLPLCLESTLILRCLMLAERLLFVAFTTFYDCCRLPPGVGIAKDDLAEPPTPPTCRAMRLMAVFCD